VHVLKSKEGHGVSRCPLLVFAWVRLGAASTGRWQIVFIRSF